jgi:gliding motility-associated-like protein
LAITLDSTTNLNCSDDSTGAIYISTMDTSQNCASSTVVINEFYVNPTGPNDGVDPNASEYIELLGPPGTDISCYVLTDGDWTITLPAGSIIPADGIFSIGNDAVYGAGTFDLDAENCNCFTDNVSGGLLIFSNGGEHLSMFDATGTFLQGVMYGSPSTNNSAPIGSAAPFAANGVINTVGLLGCVSAVTIPDSNQMERTFLATPDGTALSRSPNGSGNWAVETGGSINACNFGASSGTTAASYLWSNGDTTQNITGLVAGTYTVTVTDNAGCTSIASYTITAPPALVSTIDSITDASCSGVADGAIYTSISGGSGPYNFVWSNTNNTDDLINITTGNYTVTVTDGNGCTVTSDTIVGAGTEVIVLIDSINNTSCNTGNDGMIYTNTLNGTAPYTYNWSNGQTNQNADTLVAGVYVITVTDANGCTATNDSVIAEPTPIILNDATNNVSCGSTNDGSIVITPSGGTPGYTYLWNATAGGQTTATATGLTTNTYGITVTDANNCTVSGNGYFVSAGIPVDSADVPLQVDNGLLGCDLVSTGALSINTTGTYTYLWSNGATTRSVSGLPAGNYAVTITNGLGCFEVQNGVISAPFVPSVMPYIGAIGDTTVTTITGTPILIDGGNDQSTQGVTYAWSATPNSGLTISNTASHQTTVTPSVNGSYTLLITATSTNALNCTDTGSVTMVVENNYIGMPDAFTPNGDGVNDLFRPVGLVADDIISFRIYNRFGNLVYEGDDLANGGWDGSFGGVAQPREVYIYVLTYKNTGYFSEKSIRGRVTLLR